MKKLIGIALILSLMVTMLFSGAVFADDPTEINIDWDGAGYVGGNVNTGDAATTFSSGGSSIFGSFAAADANNNPYSYGVDSYSAYLKADVSGGYIQMITNRLTSKESMYGPAGQESGAYVGTADGIASMAVRTTTNFAALKDPTYTYQLPGGHNIVVQDSSLYEIERWVLDGQGNEGFILAGGSGSAVLDSMSSEASGNGGVRLGWGCGCYTDASYNAVGSSGLFNVTGVGNSEVTYQGLGMSSGGGTLSIIANWANSFSINDYSLTAK